MILTPLARSGSLTIIIGARPRGRGCVGIIFSGYIVDDFRMAWVVGGVTSLSDLGVGLWGLGLGLGLVVGLWAAGVRKSRQLCG